MRNTYGASACLLRNALRILLAEWSYDFLLTMTILGATDGIGSLGGQTVRAGEVSEENGMEQQQRAGEDE